MKNLSAQITSLNTQLSSLKQQRKQLQFANRPICPYCAQNKVHAYGYNPGRKKRFKCTQCKKTFSQSSGTCYHYIHHQSKFQKYLHKVLTENHHSLRKLAKEFNISLLTAFDWRHKILSVFSTTDQQLSGQVSVINTTLPFSRKGILSSKNKSNYHEEHKLPLHIIIAADKADAAFIDISAIGNISPDALSQKRIARGILPVSTQRNTHNRKGETYFSNDSFTLKSPKKMHGENNALTEKIQQQLILLIQKKARGVSTKYFSHYARWALLQVNHHKPAPIQTTKLNTVAWTSYTNIENNYLVFLKKQETIHYIQTSFRLWKTPSRYARNDASSHSDISSD